jgi:threonine dehydrogenase-like Zn-dependent dehydrogenase
MPETRTIKVLGVEREGHIYFWNYDEGPSPEGCFRLQTIYSGFSAGTELTFFKKTNPFFHSRYDEEFGVFHSHEPSTHYPVPFLGYMEVGRVVESRTSQVREGDLVAMTYGHKSGHTADAQQEFFSVLPPDIDPLLGIYVGQMGPTCANGLLHAAADVMGTAVRDLGDGVRGRNVLVIGGGVVGLLTGLFAVQHGAAQVAVADRTPQRLEAARGLGMIPVDENEVEAWRWCKERWHYGPRDRGADVVFQCRGRENCLPDALRALRPDSTVIDLTFYECAQPELRLGEEFHHNGLSIRCAQVYHQPRGLKHLWDRRRLAQETVDLLRAKGSLIREHLITDVVPFDEAPQLVADLAARRRHVIQAVFEVSI